MVQRHSSALGRCLALLPFDCPQNVVPSPAGFSDVSSSSCCWTPRSFSGCGLGVCPWLLHPALEMRQAELGGRTKEVFCLATVSQEVNHRW